MPAMQPAARRAGITEHLSTPLPGSKRSRSRAASRAHDSVPSTVRRAEQALGCGSRGQCARPASRGDTRSA
eukprot:6247492-Alexandrium_andersonii.AAC.1